MLGPSSKPIGSCDSHLIDVNYFCRSRANLIVVDHYDDANQIATFGGTSFSYDANGNLTADGSKTYTWNARNELTGLSGGVSASFAYDGFGRRRAKTVSGTTTQFLYDGLNPVQELASGTPTANLLTGLGIDEYFTRTDATGTQHYLADALGSSIALADGSGALRTEYTIDPYGGVSTSGVPTSNSIVYAGREMDGTGLHFYRARHYDPRLHRFVSEDPLAFGGGDLNLFAYAANRPTEFTDPSGMSYGSNAVFLFDWIFGIGDQKRPYGHRDPETIEFANSPGVNALRERFKNSAAAVSISQMAHMARFGPVGNAS